MPLTVLEKEIVASSEFISRDLSWVKFNFRVLDQAKKNRRSITEKLKFVAITSSNLDEFMMIRVGSLYKYLDYGRDRTDYSGLNAVPFKKELFHQIHELSQEQENYFHSSLIPMMKKNGVLVKRPSQLSEKEMRKTSNYFSKTIYPMLTPMVYDSFRAFPMLMNKTLIFGVKTNDKEDKDGSKTTFVQLPANLPRFYEIDRLNDETVFVPIEEIVRDNIDKLFKNIEIKSVGLFRITRNGDFDYDDYDDSEEDFVEEIQKKLKGRQRGRVVRLELEQGFNKKLAKKLQSKFNIEEENLFRECKFIDYTSFFQILGHDKLKKLAPTPTVPVAPLMEVNALPDQKMLSLLKDRDMFMHHPYNDIEPVLQLLEEAATDSKVLAIKITIYRLAKKSRVTKALLKAAENGKHVSVLFEVKARFDEENNIKEGRKLEKAGCFVIYGIEQVKTHTKLMMIVRQEGPGIRRYVHMSSGNYNESTAKMYTDTSYITSSRVYGNDVAEFFNVITGHSKPYRYKKLITTPGDMRKSLIYRIRKEARNAKKGLPSGIAIKVNSLEDPEVIKELYKASNVGVRTKVVVRGICCLRPNRKKLSENIEVKSIVGDFLEHTRIYYFHNEGDPKVYGGSADMMVRSFDRRIESLFLVDGFARAQMINILDYSIRDNVNSYLMDEKGDYLPVQYKKSELFNVHKEFFKVKQEDVLASKVFK